MQPGGGAAITAVIKGGVVQEVRQRFADWLTQTVRLGVGWRHAEFEHTVGPLPLKGMFPAGKEVVTRFVAPGIGSAGEMLTDSNGREMMQRQRSDCKAPTFRCSPEPIAYSYFPVTTAAAIRDKQQQLTLLVDRAVPNAQRPFPQAQRPMPQRPNAQRPIPKAHKCPMPNAQCPTPKCLMPHAPCSGGLG